MAIIIKIRTIIHLMIISCVFLCLFSQIATARMVTQLTPTLTITEEYIDNYEKTANGTEEYISTVALGFSLGFLEKNHKLYVDYNPMYRFYDRQDQNDGLDHSVSVNGELKPSKLSFVGYGLNLSQTEVDRVGESRESNIYANGSLQVSEYTSLNIAQDYSRSFDQQVDSGSWSESDTNNTSFGITHRFGDRDSIGMNYIYAFTEYKTENSNDFSSSKPSVFLTKYFTPHFGMRSNLSYETVDYDLTNNTSDTLSGSLRLFRDITRHFDIYFNYRQTYSDQTFDKHHTYHPSAGFGWKPTPDTGISLGIGIIVERYDIQTGNDGENLFFDIDMYKDFILSKRSTFSITGSSGYGEVDEDAASLGFNIYYQAGFNYTYMLTKQLNADIIGSYKISEFDNPGTNRTDATANIGVALSWTLLKWLDLNVAYDFTDFDTDSTRDDYTVNQFTVSLSFIPTRPIKMDIPATRTALENKIFK